LPNTFYLMAVGRWGLRQDLRYAAHDVEDMFKGGDYGGAMLHGATATSEAVARKLGAGALTAAKRVSNSGGDDTFVRPYDALRSSFYELAEDGSGKLDEAQLLELCGRLGMDPDRVPTLIEEFDLDGDSRLDFDEFCAIFYQDWDEIPMVVWSAQGLPNAGVAPKAADRALASTPATIGGDAWPKCMKSKDLGSQSFMDSTFTNDTNLPEDAECWVRAPHLLFGGSTLFNGIQPNDVSQGAMGDCWLLCAFAAMAEYPGLIQNCFKQKVIQESGRYHVKMWDGYAWNSVMLDDYVPAERFAAIFYAPVFAQATGSKLWVLLLEKAMAKWCGGYQNLEGGQDVCAWRIFTGCNDCMALFQDAEDENVWVLHQADWSGGAHVANCGFIPWQPVDIWDTLRQWDAEGHLMGAATWKGDSTGEKGASAGEDIRQDGIVKSHAYSILQVIEYQPPSEPSAMIRLVQLRNPWGDDHEWKGAWCDGSPEWETYPDLATFVGLRVKDDGVFWMSFEDFVHTFEQVTMCPFKRPVDKRVIRAGAPRGPLHAPVYRRPPKSGTICGYDAGGCLLS